MRRNGKINHAVEVLFDNRSVGARQRGLSAIRADLSNLRLDRPRIWTYFFSFDACNQVSANSCGCLFVPFLLDRRAKEH